MRLHDQPIGIARKMVSTERNTTEKRPLVPRKPATLSLRKVSLESVETAASVEEKVPPPVPRRPSAKSPESGGKARLPKAFPSHRAQRIGPMLSNHLNIPRGSQKLRLIAVVEEHLIGVVPGMLIKWSIASGLQQWALSLGSDGCLSMARVSEHRIALGMQQGTVWIVDLHSGGVQRRISLSGNPIWHLIRTRDELLSIDDAGWIHGWSVVGDDVAPENKTGVSRVMVRPQLASVAAGDGIWIATGTLFEMHCRQPLDEPKLLARFDLVSDLGMETISSTIGLFSHPPDTMISVHEEGQVVFWSCRECLPMETFLVGAGQRVTSSFSHDRYLWLGFSSGRLMIIDLVARDIVAEWKAHQMAVCLLHTGPSRRNPLYVPMVSVCESGCALAWDGSCAQLGISNDLLGRLGEYSSYSRISVRVCSWNVDSQRPPEDDDFWLEWLGFGLGLGLDERHEDMYVVGLQEIVDLESKSSNAKLILQNNTQKASTDEARAQIWMDKIHHILQSRIPGIVRLAGESMVGLLLTVFVDADRVGRRRIRHVSHDQVKTGLGGLHGNKGALVTRLMVDDTSLCLINCHLAAGHSQMAARNADLNSIFRAAAFKHVTAPLGTFGVAGSVGDAILDHEHCILFGDLNYRLNLTRDVAEDACREGAFKALVESHDQLRHQLSQNLFHPLATFVEADVSFAPTYKYDRGVDRFDSSEKQRVPAYCDRILLRSLDPLARIGDYGAHGEMRISDHRPISATISLRVKQVDVIRQALLEGELRREFILKLSRS